MIMQDFFKNVGREKVGGAEMEVTDNDFLRKIRMEKTLTRILARVSVNVCFGKVLCEEFCGHAEKRLPRRSPLNELFHLTVRKEKVMIGDFSILDLLICISLILLICTS